MINKITILLLFCLICFSSVVYASDHIIENYKIDATIKEDGSIDVVEYIQYKFFENRNGVYRDILYKYTFAHQKNDLYPTSSRYQASDIDNINVYVSDTSFENMKKSQLHNESMVYIGMDNVYSLTDVISNGYRKNIKVYSPVASNNSKYVKYEYTIKDAIVNYIDNAEIYWNFVGKDWQAKIQNLEINVDFGVSNIEAYGHTYANIDSFNINGNILNMKVSNIKPGIAVDVRGVFPNIYIGNVNKFVNENYDFNMLYKIENKMSKDKDRYILSEKIWNWYIVIYIIVVLYILYKSGRYKNKNVKKYSKVEHYMELPNEFSLGEYSVIRNRLKGYSDSNLVLATILDLSNRKYIRLECIKIAKFLKDKYEYYVSVNTTKDLENLNDYEKELLNYIFNKKISSNISVNDFKNNRFELNERFKELGKEYNLATKYKKLITDKYFKYDRKMYNEVPKKLWKTFIYSFLILIITAMINIFVISPLTDKNNMMLLVIFVNMFVFIPLVIIIANRARSLKDEYVQAYNQMLGLEKYLKEYSLIKTRYPIELVLWEKYLVFASLFGIADKVSKEFKEELLKQGYDENYIYSTYPIISMGIYSHSMTSSISSSTGTVSSGGYSGGGSGGGGGRWWRRWFFLN